MKWKISVNNRVVILLRFCLAYLYLLANSIISSIIITIKYMHTNDTNHIINSVLYTYEKPELMFNFNHSKLWMEFSINNDCDTLMLIYKHTLYTKKGYYRNLGSVIFSYLTAYCIHIVLATAVIYLYIYIVYTCSLNKYWTDENAQQQFANKNRYTNEIWF